jgi:hypothetical protein
MSEFQLKSTTLKTGSDRVFGLVFSILFVCIGIWPILFKGPARVWALIIGGIFLSLVLTKPILLHPLNVIWFKFGLILHKIVSPIILGILFFLVITPIGLWIRMFKKDPLNLKFDLELQSYWIAKEESADSPSSLKNQF